MIAADVCRALDAVIDREAAALTDLARRIHAHPELRFQEEKAAAWISELLEQRGFAVERGLAALSTALRARAGHGAVKVAVLAEYDALPDIGHACGHNLIAAASVGAFLAAASVVLASGGEVILIGTPAEEGGGGKIRMLEAGVFQDLDAAMMFHPFDRDVLAHSALASAWLTLEFTGVASHAALAPQDGKSALTACLDAFRLVDGQRVHFRDGVRVHGFVSDGGRAVNVIPECAAAQFSIRAPSMAELARAQATVERCGRAAALASDVAVKITTRRGYRDMRNNMTLARAFGRHLEAFGRTPRESDARVGAGSTDMGDVSHVVPAIHPYLAIVDEGEAMCHEHRFAAAAVSDRGLDTMLQAARAMARTMTEFLRSSALREAVKAEWAAEQPGA